MEAKYFYNRFQILKNNLFLMYTGNATNIAQTVVELPEIVNNLLLLLSEKEKYVIKKRFSLNGLDKHTLEQIGQEFSVTRERVRQIEKCALGKMRRNVFNTALRGLHEFADSVVTDAGGFLREESLIGAFSGSLPEGVKAEENCVHLSLVLHEELECVGNTIDFHPYVKKKDVPAFNLKHASKHLINQLHKYGNVKSLERIHSDLNPVLKDINFDLDKVKSLIEIDKRVAILEDEMVGLLEWRHVNPRTLRDKILYILRRDKDPMHFNDIAKKIEDADFDNRSVNVQAVHNELIRHPQFVLIGRGIYALKEWGYESGTVAKVIQRVLSEEGELSQDEIIERVLERRQVKDITVVLALKNGEEFERIGRKRYKLKST